MTWFVAIIFNQGISKRQQARDWNIMTYLNFYLQCESFERSLGLNLKKIFKTFLNRKQLQFIYKRFIARAREWERINSHSNWECTVSSFVRIDLFLSNHQKVPQIERKILSWKHDFHNFSRINFFSSSSSLRHDDDNQVLFLCVVGWNQQLFSLQHQIVIIVVVGWLLLFC